MMNLIYYITGHGLGHATRSVGLIQQLLNSGANITIVSSVKPDFFTKNLVFTSDSLRCIERSLDTGAIQTDPISVDPLSTLNTYYNTIHLKRNSIISTETSFLTSIEYKVDAILTDATSIICHIAKTLNIKCFIISNFTWDYIYQEMLQSISSTIDEKSYNELSQMVEDCIKDYKDADLYIRLPGYVPLASSQCSSSSIPIFEAPMLCRTAKISKENLKLQLKIDPSLKVLVIAFGGHKNTRCLNFSDDHLPPGWIGLAFGVTHEEVAKTTRFKAVSFDVYMPDYINLADAVLGKIGYGTVSECLAHGTPLIYVPRSHWPEEPYLAAFLNSMHAGIELDADSYYNGDWGNAILSATSRHRSWDITSLKIESSSQIIADHVFKILRSTHSYPK